MKVNIMSTGLGIAIAGVWMLPAACALAPKVTSTGFIMGLVLASCVTVFLVSYNS